MNILQINARDTGGGAEKVALDLFKSYRRLGHNSWLAVGTKQSEDSDIFEIPVLPRSTNSVARQVWSLRTSLLPFVGEVPGVGKLSGLLDAFVRPQAFIERLKGREDFNFPNGRQILELPPKRPDIIHLHNLHGAYFDLRFLSELSLKFPVVITMHDEWLYTGHCACTMGCERWQIGCGHCPDLSIYPALKRDGTALNWLRKRTIYQNSCLYVAAPSQWLFNNLEKSMINISENKVIPNGVDISVFRPAFSRAIRIELGLPLDSFILIFVANAGKDNPFKDYSTIERALLSLDATNVARKVEIIILGGSRTGEDKIGNLQVHYVGFQREASVVAKYYQASDVYLHATRSENFPVTILEAFACEIPVIATSVGGIREQIDDGETGYLIPAGDYQAMASRIRQLLLDDDLRTKMGKRCREVVTAKYDLEKQARRYLEWYEEILSEWTV